MSEVKAATQAAVEEMNEVAAAIAAIDDPRDAYVKVTRAISDCERDGRVIPQALIDAREFAAIECEAESQGR